MSELQGTIDDFVEIETYIDDKIFETSHYGDINKFFSTHLFTTKKSDGKDWYGMKVGDALVLEPTHHASILAKGAELSEKYKSKYEVVNIRIEYYGTDPTKAPPTPTLKVMIYLKAI